MEAQEILEEALGPSIGTRVEQVVRQFQVYRDLIIDWNRKISLISKRDETRLVSRHFLQSAGLITILELPGGARVMDLGSGAGFPGIPVKLVRPDLHVVLVESVQKKAAFLRTAISVLELEKIEVYAGRAEDLDAGKTATPWILSRGVSDLLTLVRWCRRFIPPEGGNLAVIKGSGIFREMNILKTKAESMGITETRIIPYDPYPGFFRLDASYVALLNINNK